MDRTLIIPLSFAAALHAGVLFGFQRSLAPKPVKVIEEVIRIVMPPRIEDVDPVHLVDDDAGKKSRPMSVVPRGIDESVPRPEGFAINLPKVLPVDVANVTKIGPVTIGIPDGLGEAAREGILLGKHLDNPPRTRTQIPPPYPFEAKQRGINGRVLVEFIVDETGRVVAPRVVDATDRMFEEPTLRAVAKWRFEPGRRHGQVVRFRMALPVEFNLNDER